MLNGQEAATAGDHEAVELEYSEKDLDDALSYLDSQRRASASSRVPGWAKRLADSTRVVSRKTGAVSRRSLLGCCLALMVFLTIVTTSLGEADTDSFNLVSEPTLKQESRPAGVLDAVVKAPARVAGAVKELGWSAWDKAVGASVEKPKVWKGLNPLHVLNYDTPQATMKMQLKEGVRYMTSMAFGGHANQFISIQKMLYFSQQTNRVAIIPTLLPVHIDGLPVDITKFFDLDRFFEESQVPAVPISAVKAMDFADETPNNEVLPCFSVQEATVGGVNGDTWGFDLHDIDVHFWPLPPGLARGLGGFDIAYDALRMFDFDINGKNLWAEKVRKELLPQMGEHPQPISDHAARLANVKSGFAPEKAVAHNDQVMCFDNTLFMGPVMFHETYEGDVPRAPGVPGEGLSWIAVGQHLRFNKHVEDLADQYLMKLFDVSAAAQIPPFITIHLRRGDFKDFTGYTSLDKYVEALARLRKSLQQRLEDPYGWTGPGRANFRTHGLRADQYTVVTTTDEPKGSPFIQEVKALGWKVLDHEAEETKERLGGWYPTMLDGAILARGVSFVGTDRSTFSHLAGLRVKYWRGGLVETAWR